MPRPCGADGANFDSYLDSSFVVSFRLRILCLYEKKYLEHTLKLQLNKYFQGD